MSVCVRGEDKVLEIWRRGCQVELRWVPDVGGAPSCGVEITETYYCRVWETVW